MVTRATPTAAAAAAAECHYQSGRFSQAADAIERCCNEEKLPGSIKLFHDVKNGHSVLDSATHNIEGASSSSSSLLTPTDAREIIVATSNDSDSSPLDGQQQQNSTKNCHNNEPHQYDVSAVTSLVDLIALPPLAHRADLAMCQFRSSSNTTSFSSCRMDTTSNSRKNTEDQKNNENNCETSSSEFCLWTKAKQANQDYRMGLRSAAISLVKTAAAAAFSSTSCCSNDDNKSQLISSILNAMKSTSLAILMAGVAASHLYLYQTNSPHAAAAAAADDDDTMKVNTTNNDGYDGSEYNDKKAWKVLVNSAALAANLMSARREFIRRYYRNDDDNALNDDNGGDNDDESTQLASTTTKSILEESLYILNETLFTTITTTAAPKHTKSNNTRSNNNNNNWLGKNEREAMAMQSFRTALKVAALSCGKIILPTVEEEEKDGDAEDDVVAAVSTRCYSKQSNKKRRRATRDEGITAAAATITTMTSNSNDRMKRKNVWSVIYTSFSSYYSNPILQSRERIVDALSFHYCATSTSTKIYSSFSSNYDEVNLLLRNKRNICLEEGRIWEEKSNNSGGDGLFAAGYAWKMKHCLEGMDVASSSSSSSQPLRPPSSSQDVDTMRSLRRLALSSSSKFACDLLGCIYAKRGEIERALEMFQSSLEHAATTDNSDEDDVASSAQRRTLVNMALCFLALGEANTPVELLLHLWMTLSSGSISLVGAGSRPRSVELLLTSKSADVGLNYSKSASLINNSTREQLLWMLFFASSLSQDWATCLNCTEEMNEKCNYTVVSRVFALLQCRRPSNAQDMIQRLISTLMTVKDNAEKDSVEHLSAELLLILAGLYNADAYLLLERERSLDYTIGKISPLTFIQSVDETLSSIVAKVDSSSSLVLELQILMANNQGVARIIDGDSVGAIGSFRKATQLLKSAMMNDNSGSQLVPLLLIPPFFNLSLILLRDGHVEESARSWLRARKHLPCWEKAIRGDSEALKKLRDNHTMAINKHVILTAKRRMRSEAAGWDQENVMEWVPPSFEAAELNEEEQSSPIGGVDVLQVIALDVILLRYAVSFAEKKAAASFRKSAGYIGY